MVHVVVSGPVRVALAGGGRIRVPIDFRVSPVKVVEMVGVKDAIAKEPLCKKVPV